MAEMRSIGMPLTDEKAEAAALGGMLMSEGHPLDCRDEVVERLSEVGARAFYNQDHQKIYQAIVDCMLGNEPTDPVAVVAQLRKKGELTQELMHLVHELPRHAGLLTGAIEDARTILDLHRRRELHRTLMDSDNLVLSATGSYEEVAGDVYGAVSDVVDSAVKPTTLFTSIEVVDAALGHLFGEKEIVPGIPTGINDLDELIGGLYPGQMIVLAGRPGHGKALALDTPLPTPTGWTTMGEVKVGDQVLGADGRATTVTFATEVQYNRTCYRLTFSDGQTVVADADHLWSVTTSPLDEGPDKVVTTQELVDSPVRYWIRGSKALELPEIDLPVDPRELGRALGAGGIPEEYLRASLRQRTELMEALLSSDRLTGWPEGFNELKVSLGLNGPVWIEKIEEVESVPVRCIQVDNEDHLYLCTRSMIPTHNTTLGAQIARNLANSGVPTVFFSLEMPKEELGQRNASAETGVAFSKIREGKVSSKELADLAEYVDQQEDKPLFVDDDPDQSVGEISLKTRKLVRERGVKVAVIDYLQMTKPDGGGTGHKNHDVAEVSDGLRKMARKLGITVIALAQLNRGSTTRGEDNKPKITDLRDSGEIEEDANVVILVHLEFKVDPDTERGKVADIIVAKNRGGRTAEFEMVFDGAHSRFIDPSTVIGGGR